ncbi:uncharacterized protein DUF3606 [Bosea sp. 124]|nr:uncharacterized protein DUF3606 [Bosea sp. 124]
MAGEASNPKIWNRSHVDLSKDSEVQYWTETLGLSKIQLIQVILKVGTSAKAVFREVDRMRETSSLIS